MKSWWFYLYTTPFLKRSTLYFFIAIILDLVLSRTNFYFSFMIYVFPLFVLNLRFRPGSFRSNLEFHKSQINFSELRKYYVLDLLITSLFFIFLLLLALLTSSLLEGSFSKLPASMILTLPIGAKLSYLFILFNVLTWTGFISTDTQYSFLGLKFRSSFKKVFLLGLIWISLPVLIFVFGYLSFQVEFINFLFLGSLTLAAVLFYLQSFFHLTEARASIFKVILYTFFGFFLHFSFYFLTFFFTTNLLMQKKVSVLERLNYYRFYSPLMNNLNEDAFLFLEPNLKALERFRLYQKINFNASKLGVNYFLDQSKNQERLVTFLRSGSPTEDFIHQLFLDIENRALFWNKIGSLNQILYLAFSRWPQGVEIPPSQLTLKLKADEFKAEIKQKRKPSALSR